MEERNLLIVSDLHLSEGLNPKDATLSHLEDFVFDDEFARFLDYHERVKAQPRFGGRPWLLVINGDQFDFLQVVSLPDDGEDLLSLKGVAWSSELPADERKYGLGTTEAESVWKLKRIAAGHPRYFAALGRFAAFGNSIAVVTGNHDVELHWPAVRRQFVREAWTAFEHERKLVGNGRSISLEKLETLVSFHSWFYYESGRIFIEHGGQYEGANAFRNFLNPVDPVDPERIEIPLGSLFVRYLFNKLEDVHPFADNVKPLSRYLNWALKTDPLAMADVLLGRGHVFLRAAWHVTRQSIASARVSSEARARIASVEKQPLSLPGEVTNRLDALHNRRVSASWQMWIESSVCTSLSVLLVLTAFTFVVLAGVSLLDGPDWLSAFYLGTAAVAYFVRRLVGRTVDAVFEKDYLLEAARGIERILGDDHQVAYIAMGHSHQAKVCRVGGAWYVNTGAWVPLFESRGPTLGHERLTFFRHACGYDGTPELLSWDRGASAPVRYARRR